MERGQFARAQEIQIFFSLMAVLSVIAMIGRSSVERIMDFSAAIFTQFGAMQVRPDTVTAILTEIMLTVAPVVLPLLVACGAAAFVGGGLQTGFRLTPKTIGFNWDRFNPVTGFQRVFANDMLSRAGIDVLKMIAVGPPST